MSELGQNSFHLDFKDTSGATPETLGKDKSGKNNNWTPNNVSVKPTLARISDSTGGLPTLETTGNYGKSKKSNLRSDSLAANLVLSVAMHGANNSTVFLDERVSANSLPSLEIQYLVIAGGGGGGSPGGGGAGGYRSSVSGESSGGGTLAEAPFLATLGTSYTVTIGGGGTGSRTAPTNGQDSIFATITSLGGGRGGAQTSTASATGGSGGGGSYGGVYQAGSAGTTAQGYAGGNGIAQAGAGGGGAGAAGGNAVDGPADADIAGNGGNGLTSSITGAAIARGGGGGGGNDYRGSHVPGSGGSGGGGAGSDTQNASGGAGTANTGGGGGGGDYIGTSSTGGPGGSGVIILKYAKALKLAFTPGVVQTTEEIGDFKITTITAAGATDTVTVVSGKPLTKVGSPVVSTGESKFYGSSGYFNGSSYLSSPASEDFAFGTGDFTIEGWCYTGTTSGRKTIFSTASASGNSIWVGLESGTTLPRVYTNTTAGPQSSLRVGTNTWAHVAVVRSSGTLRIYVDGVQGASAADSTDYTSQNCWIGYDGQLAAHAFSGYLQDIRVYKGVAKYTSAFTVPGVIATFDQDVLEDVPFASKKDQDTFEMEYVIIGGGAGGSDTAGGGAGGYRSSVEGEMSGGGASAQAKLVVVPGRKNPIFVGAGGSAGGNNERGSSGQSSYFSTVSVSGGGPGAEYNNGSTYGGGSGGGSSLAASGGAGTVGEGYAGGAGQGTNASPYSGGGGGGAGGVGTAGTTTIQGGNGGPGVLSFITGEGVYRAGGGGGQTYLNVNVGSQGGIGGGGNGARGNSRNQLSTAGTANTGGGGGGGDSDAGGSSYLPKAGGSGVVILRYPSHIELEFSAGVVQTTSILADKKVTVVTAAGSTDYVVAKNTKTVGNFGVWNPFESVASEFSRASQVAALEEVSVAVACGTTGVTSGKWYWEITPMAPSVSHDSSETSAFLVGIADLNAAITTRQYLGSSSWYYYGLNGNKYAGSASPTSASYGAGYGANDVIGVALDMDAGSVTFYKNGVSQGVAYTGVLTGKKIAPAVASNGTYVRLQQLARRNYFANFGQKDFAFAIPAGHKAINEANTGVQVKKPNFNSIDDVSKVQYLVIAGGGAGGIGASGGGGAGGYRSSVIGEKSGGGSNAEPMLSISLNIPYTVTIGAGGSPPVVADYVAARGVNGGNSRFANIISLGGGGGATLVSKTSNPLESSVLNRNGLPGGSGGGAAPEGGGGATGGADWGPAVGGSGMPGQGFKGGNHEHSGIAGAGGGGAGGPGEDSSPVYGGSGGIGVASEITGSVVYRAGGGGGNRGWGNVGGYGGLGGGGNGVGSLPANTFSSETGAAGAANTGGGGGGANHTTPGGFASAVGSPGGSGVVILKYSSLLTLTFSAGVTSSTITTSDGFKVTTITAAGPTDTVTFASAVLETQGNFIKGSIADDLPATAATQSDLTVVLNSPIPLSILEDTEEATFDYLVVGGGGGGGHYLGGGGGAGGVIQKTTKLKLNTNYAVTVGLGGLGSTLIASNGANGSNSKFDTDTAIGGGGGASWDSSIRGSTGASAGGGTGFRTTQAGYGGAGFFTQGNSGGNGSLGNNFTPEAMGAGGGGGAGTSGSNGNRIKGGDGGAGILWLDNNLYAGGGGGGFRSRYAGTSRGLGNAGGGSGGSWSYAGSSATVNTGSGGGGGGEGSTAISTGGNGGSGAVVLRYPATLNLQFSAGVVQTTTTVGTKKITVITAAGPTDTVSFASTAAFSPTIITKKVARFKNSAKNKIQYLVIAGGGAGGSYWWGGGGGAGGYRSNVPGELSGGNSSPESDFFLALGKPYAVTVGLGGSPVSPGTGQNGQTSQFASIISQGGGAGGGNSGVGVAGGSGGGGAGSSAAGGAATANQGFAGAAGSYPVDNLGWSGTLGSNYIVAGGGGGAGGAGLQATYETGSLNSGYYGSPSGGPGISSSITGTAVTRAGGGGGIINSSNSRLYFGLGGAGGGRNSASYANWGGLDTATWNDDAPNTGGGGGGALWSHGGPGSAGCSGVVILRYAKELVITCTPGIQQSTTIVGTDKVTVITAAGPTDSITFNLDTEQVTDDDVIFEDEITIKVPLYCSAQFSTGVDYTSVIEGSSRVFRVLSAKEGETVTFSYIGKLAFSTDAVNVEYVVVAGGGGGATSSAGAGGGAGGYRSNVPGELTGQNNASESAFIALAKTAYTITVGQGGTGGASSNFITYVGTNGSNSVLANITAIGGGGGSGDGHGNAGGSGSGTSLVYTRSGGAGTVGQGFKGGSTVPASGVYGAAGGGGAGSQGGDSRPLNGGAGGSGIASAITGTLTYRAGGGGGGIFYTGTPGAAGVGGGSAGANRNQNPANATAETGGGGGGGSRSESQYWTNTYTRGANGGSGVVILRIPMTNSASFTSGVTFTSSTVGNYRVYIVTAAGPTDTVTFI